MPDMADIRAGIAANLATLEGVQISPYRLDNPTPPTIQVTGLDEMEPTAFRGGGYSFVVIVQGFVGISSDRGAQVNLDRWLFPSGPLTVWEALETDRTLGGSVSDSMVIRSDGAQVFTLPNRPDVLGSTWYLQIEI